jgi:hypothetical protein
MYITAKQYYEAFKEYYRAFSYLYGEDSFVPDFSDLSYENVYNTLEIYKERKAQEYKHTPKFLEEDNHCSGQQGVKCPQKVSYDVNSPTSSVCRGKDGLSYATNWDKDRCKKS